MPYRYQAQIPIRRFFRQIRPVAPRRQPGPRERQEEPPFGPPVREEMPPFGQPGGVPPFGQPGGGPPFGQPGGGPPFGQPGGPPSGPPPTFVPAQRGGITPRAIDPGAIRGCLFRYVYIWLVNGRQFWAWLVFVGPRSIAGWRWNGFTWVYFGTDLENISSFVCF
jgi:hypothetical protein